MLRTLLRPAAALAGLITGAVVVALPVPAAAETTDGTLTVTVNRDVDGNGNYDDAIDQPLQGIEIAVTDASGSRVKGVTERDGTFVLEATSKLEGGRYFVVAEIPAALSDLTPVPESSSFPADEHNGRRDIGEPDGAHGRRGPSDVQPPKSRA